MEKRNYSVVKNIIFTHKYVLQEYKIKYWTGAGIVVLATIFITFMFTLLPAYVASLLVEESSVSKKFIKINRLLFNFVFYNNFV